MNQLTDLWHALSIQIDEVEEQLRTSAETAPAKEMEARKMGSFGNFT